MLELKTKARKWGNSVGVLLPKKFGIRPNQDIKLHIEPEKPFTKVKEIFGTVKLRKSVEQLMREVDAELEPEV